MTIWRGKVQAFQWTAEHVQARDSRDIHAHVLRRGFPARNLTIV